MVLKYIFLSIFLVLSHCSHNGDFMNDRLGEKLKGGSAVTSGLSLSEEDCPPMTPCEELKYPCITCLFNETCVYGNITTAKCNARMKCKGIPKFERKYICRFCYQTERWEHKCVEKGSCDSVASPKAYYRTNCTVHDDVLCLGRRTFARNIPCNWTGGHRWSTALFLSITLGGFGADRFYLGYWQEGIGKLFSFGGLGVWTIIDFILIAIQYLGPADGSLYI
ncbi:unnamed protein product [Nezara viridula]|uniref:TM2 domain-containing protein n=1 Tax=Nezara viridula TaxID=85310 RepID=A0A9P0HMT0_NEZVI|nr:unnamed protein product [Nezara viridula]